MGISFAVSSVAMSDSILDHDLDLDDCGGTCHHKGLYHDTDAGEDASMQAKSL